MCFPAPPRPVARCRPGLPCGAARCPRPFRAAQGGSPGAADSRCRSGGARLVLTVAGGPSAGSTRRSTRSMSIRSRTGDTGTNLYLTVESAVQAVEAVFASARDRIVRARARRGDAVDRRRRALIGARGNSGTILAQGSCGGMAERLGEGDRAPSQGGARCDGPRGWHARRSGSIRRGDDPERGSGEPRPKRRRTSPSSPADEAGTARAAYEGARSALDATPGGSSPCSSARGSWTRAGAGGPC